MAEYIDRTELELDTEWSDYDDGFVSYSQSQIRSMPKADVVEREKVNKAIKEMERYSTSFEYANRHDLADAVDYCIGVIQRNIGE